MTQFGLPHDTKFLHSMPLRHSRLYNQAPKSVNASAISSRYFLYSVGCQLVFWTLRTIRRILQSEIIYKFPVITLPATD